MLLACRLAGLSALEAHFDVHAQMLTSSRPQRGLLAAWGEREVHGAALRGTPAGGLLCGLARGGTVEKVAAL